MLCVSYLRWNLTRSGIVQGNFPMGTQWNQVNAAFGSLVVRTCCEMWPDAHPILIEKSIRDKLHAVRKTCIDKYKEVR